MPRTASSWPAGRCPRTPDDRPLRIGSAAAVDPGGRRALRPVAVVGRQSGRSIACAMRRGGSFLWVPGKRSCSALTRARSRHGEAPNDIRPLRAPVPEHRGFVEGATTTGGVRDAVLAAVRRTPVEGRERGGDPDVGTRRGPFRRPPPPRHSSHCAGSSARKWVVPVVTGVRRTGIHRPAPGPRHATPRQLRRSGRGVARGRPELPGCSPVDPDLRVHCAPARLLVGDGMETGGGRRSGRTDAPAPVWEGVYRRDPNQTLRTGGNRGYTPDPHAGTVIAPARRRGRDTPRPRPRRPHRHPAALTRPRLTPHRQGRADPVAAETDSQHPPAAGHLTVGLLARQRTDPRSARCPGR